MPPSVLSTVGLADGVAVVATVGVAVGEPFAVGVAVGVTIGVAVGAPLTMRLA